MILDKENILYRVFSRIIIINIRGTDYTIRAPNALLRYQAELYKQKILDEYKYELPYLEYYDQFLIMRQFIDADHEKKTKDMIETIKRLKVELYQCGPLIEREKELKRTLKIMKDKLNSYLANIEFMRKPTLEYFAENLKNKFILFNTIFSNDKLVLDPNNLDICLLNIIIDKLNEYDISGTQFREIARTTPWQDYWRSNKNDLFGIPSIEFSEEQKILCSLSRMYDSVWEHQESPSEDVINDDDKLDGFLIYQSEKQKNQVKQNHVTIPDRFDEVYITARSQEEADSIYSSNSEESKRIMRQRARVLKSKDEVKDLDFADRRMQLLEQTSAGETAAIQSRSRG